MSPGHLLKIIPADLLDTLLKKAWNPLLVETVVSLLF